MPQSFVENGEIVLNLSAAATRRLTIDNQWVQFNARFNGASQEIAVPMSAVAGIFAKETGYGFAFTVSADPVASLDAATAPGAALGEAADSPEANGEGKPKRPSHLQIIK